MSQLSDFSPNFTPNKFSAHYHCKETAQWYIRKSGLAIYKRNPRFESRSAGIFANSSTILCQLYCKFKSDFYYV